MKASCPLQHSTAYVDTTELLILVDGRILVHNLTPAFAQLLQSLNAEDELIRQRATASEPPDPTFHEPGHDAPTL